MYTPYDIIKFWLPVASAFALVVKGFVSVKQSVSTWMESLLGNHLHTIQEAVTNTHLETVKTNDILSAHHEKEMLVWDGVVKTLAVIEDRTHSPRRKC